MPPVKQRRAPAREPGYEGRFDLAGWALIRAVMRRKRIFTGTTPTLIDLGMGRGRDLIYFARRGFRVSGIDLAPEGLERARRRAARLHARIRTEVADLRDFRWQGQFDVVFSSSYLNYLPRRVRAQRFADFKTGTTHGGIHAMNAFVPTPGRALAPDLEPGVSLYRPGELRGYYRDWEMLEASELLIECHASGVRHQHAWELVVARKPGPVGAPARPPRRPKGPRPSS